jgi:hypothetical protein
MDAMTVNAGIKREEQACRACGKPRSTLFVPANEVVYKPRKGDEKAIEQTISVTVCLACDGGIEWRSGK